MGLRSAGNRSRRGDKGVVGDHVDGRMVGGAWGKQELVGRKAGKGGGFPGLQ